MSMLRTGSVSALALAAFIAAACNGSTPLAPTAPTPPPAAPVANPGGNPGGTPASATITITAAGIDPKTVTVTRGGTVVFTNSDSVAHFPASNPHPAHTDCPEVTIGSLAPGQSKATQVLNTARVCGFHDHNNPQNDALKGTITIQ